MKNNKPLFAAFAVMAVILAVMSPVYAAPSQNAAVTLALIAAKGCVEGCTSVCNCSETGACDCEDCNCVNCSCGNCATISSSSVAKACDCTDCSCEDGLCAANGCGNCNTENCKGSACGSSCRGQATCH